MLMRIYEYELSDFIIRNFMYNNTKNTILICTGFNGLLNTLKRIYQYIVWSGYEWK